MNKNDYLKLIENSLRTVDRENLKSYHFSKKAIFDKLENDLYYKLPYDLYNTFHKYIDLIIEQVLEIRKEDCFTVFNNGFKKGVEFERYLVNNYEKRATNLLFFS